MRPACTGEVSRFSAARGSIPMLRLQLSFGEVVRYGIVTRSKSKDRPGKVANPARGQLNRENVYFPVRVRA